MFVQVVAKRAGRGTEEPEEPEKRSFPPTPPPTNVSIEMLVVTLRNANLTVNVSLQSDIISTRMKR